jgi:hypothetical protein
VVIRFQGAWFVLGFIAVVQLLHGYGNVRLFMVGPPGGHNAVVVNDMEWVVGGSRFGLVSRKRESDRSLVLRFRLIDGA